MEFQTLKLFFQNIEKCITSAIYSKTTGELSHSKYHKINEIECEFGHNERKFLLPEVSLADFSKMIELGTNIYEVYSDSGDFEKILSAKGAIHHNFSAQEVFKHLRHSSRKFPDPKLKILDAVSFIKKKNHSYDTKRYNIFIEENILQYSKIEKCINDCKENLITNKYDLSYEKRPSKRLERPISEIRIMGDKDYLQYYFKISQIKNKQYSAYSVNELNHKFTEYIQKGSLLNFSNTCAYLCYILSFLRKNDIKTIDALDVLGNKLLDFINPDGSLQQNIYTNNIYRYSRHNDNNNKDIGEILYCLCEYTKYNAKDTELCKKVLQCFQFYVREWKNNQNINGAPSLLKACCTLYSLEIGYHDKDIKDIYEFLESHIIQYSEFPEKEGGVCLDDPKYPCIFTTEVFSSFLDVYTISKKYFSKDTHLQNNLLLQKMSSFISQLQITSENDFIIREKNLSKYQGGFRYSIVYTEVITEYTIESLLAFEKYLQIQKES